MLTRFNWWFITGIIVFIAGIIFEIYLFVNPIWNLNDRAALGDAINGLTAPAIGIAGAILIYISFKEQVKANKFQFQTLHEQRELDLLYRFYAELKDDLKTLQPYYGDRHNQGDILDVFMQEVLDDKHATSPYPDVSKFLDYIFKQFSFISMRICKNEILTNNEKVHLVEKVRQLFNLYFEIYYARIVEREWTSRFSSSFKENLAWGGKAMINLNMLSIEILKDRYKTHVRQK